MFNGWNDSLRAICAAALIASGIGGSAKASELTDCTNCAAWNAPQAPFKIYGNTYYVGVHGLSAILIASDNGHILIDGDLKESAPLIEAHIRALGFRIEDVKLILNSHTHFDHAGGIAELQRMSGAAVAASPWSKSILQHGGVGQGDPQFGEIRGIDPVGRTKIVNDKETLHVGPLAVTAIFTPGHTPGGTSWTWRSCENERCVNVVYADSLSAVSAGNFLFSHNPRAMADFEKSFRTIADTPCDILLTPHPEASGTMEKAAKQNSDAASNPFINRDACRRFAELSRSGFEKRIETEKSSAP